MNDCEVIIGSGLKEGMAVSLNPRIPAGEEKVLPD
jgi:hypothetical protein